MKEEREIVSEIVRIMQKYPQKKAALIPILHMFQEKFGFISPEMEKFIAGALGIPPSSVREVTDFYSMFKRKAIGKYHITVCSSISCHLLGAKNIMEFIQQKLGIFPGEVTRDRMFSLEEVSCLGYCDVAPALMINDEVYGNLTVEKIEKILKELSGERK